MAAQQSTRAASGVQGTQGRSLRKFGYATAAKPAVRHEALKQAIREYGKHDVMKMLQMAAERNYPQASRREAGQTLWKDFAWVAFSKFRKYSRS